MASFGLPSPLQTQGPWVLSPEEKLGNWLASRGLDAEKVDVLRRKHNQRLQNVENEHDFLTHLQAVVKTRLKPLHHSPAYSFPTKSELDQIDASLASQTSDANTQLRAQFITTRDEIFLDALILLPPEKGITFLSFINNDTANDRLRFINDVLPFFVRSLSAKVAEESEARSEQQTLVNSTPSPPQPVSGRSRKERRYTIREGKSYRVTKTPRRSERMKRRAEDIQNQMPVNTKKRKRSSKERDGG